jgi:polar amino acid transport system substrate-binding protein
MFRHARLVLPIVMLFAATDARAQTLPPDIAKSGTVTSALNADYPPMEMKDPTTGQIEGFDIDLANAMAKVLHVKMAWQDGAFEAMMPALQSHRVDMIISGLSDLPVRRASFDFVDYIKSGAQVFTLISDTDLKTLTDLCGKTIATSLGTSYPGIIQAWSAKHCVAAGKPPINVLTDNELSLILLDMKEGRADDRWARPVDLSRLRDTPQQRHAGHGLQQGRPPAAGRLSIRAEGRHSRRHV